MKLSYISMTILLVAVPVAPTVRAQTPAADSQSAVTNAANPGQSASPTAEVPRLIKFSGTLLDAQERPMAGPVGVTFALYAHQTGGAALWLETQNVKPDENGSYTVLLGAASVNGVPVELFTSAEARWLGIQVGQQVEKERILLVSVPYALKAGDAQTLGGLPPSAFAPATSSPSSSAPSSSGLPMALLTPALAPASAPSPLVTSCTVIAADGTATGNQLAKFTGPCTVHQSILFDNGTNVGIGNSAPTAKLDISGNAIVRGSLQLPATGTATSTTSFNSNPLDAFASAFNSTSTIRKAQNQLFRWQVEPVGNNTTAPSGKLSLLFGANGATPAETGFSITSKGIINFALGQTLPLVTGNETVSGNVSANELISTVATGTAPLKVTSKTQVANLNASFLGGLPPSAFASSGSNAFITSQSITTNGGGASLSVIQNSTFGGEGSPGISVTESSFGGGPAIIASSGSGFGAMLVTSTGVGPAISASGGRIRATGLVAGPVLELGPPNEGDLISAGGFGVSATGTGTFTGVGAGTSTTPPLITTIGDVGCGVGDSLVGSAGIEIRSFQLTTDISCGIYNLLGDAVNTFLNAPTGGAIKFRINNADQMILTPGGALGIQTTAPDAALTVNGGADKPGGGSWGTFSDGRLKNVFGTYRSSLKQVLQLNPIRYQYKEENALGIHDSAEHIGLVAQEVEKVIPEAVSANNKGYLLVNNDPIIWSMLNAIKEQQRQISAQHKQLRIQAAELAKLKARLEGHSAQPAPR